MEQNKVLDFYAKVFRLLLELDRAHYDNNTARPTYYHDVDALINDHDTVDELIRRLREGTIYNNFSASPRVIELMLDLADDIEFSTVYDSEYQVSDMDIELELNDGFFDDHGYSEDVCEDKVYYDIKRDLEERRYLAGEGALKVAAELRELARSAEEERKRYEESRKAWWNEFCKLHPAEEQ